MRLSIKLHKDTLSIIHDHLLGPAKNCLGKSRVISDRKALFQFQLAKKRHFPHAAYIIVVRQDLLIRSISPAPGNAHQREQQTAAMTLRLRSITIRHDNRHFPDGIEHAVEKAGNIDPYLVEVPGKYALYLVGHIRNERVDTDAGDIERKPPRAIS